MRSEKENFVGRVKGFFSGRVKDVLLFGCLALVLVYAAWKVFDDQPSEKADLPLSETEIKVMRLLEEIDGVGEASVVVCESEEGVQSVVVVCEGARNFQVVIDVREAVAAALGTSPKSVKVYLKKE